MPQMVAGMDPGQRRLNGPQTSGRTYRNLSVPAHGVTRDDDIGVPMRDAITLLADVHRPAEPGKYPVLIAASPYPRQIQDLGAPAGFIEAGCSDFFVPRGYVHVIVNLRGTGGSGGTFGLFDSQERRDVYDVVEWAAAQEWSDGNVGMLGISYFAMTQMEAAVERPPHLKAIMPVAGTFDLYEAAYHHGLFSSSFMTPFLALIGLTSARTNKVWRGGLIKAARRVLQLPAIHKKFATSNGEAAMTGLKLMLKLPHDPRPWDELWQAIAVEHPARDAWWDERDLVPLLANVDIPVYLGCDWQNVPLHLPSTFSAFERLTNSPHVRVTMLGEFGLTWPWESLHVEALAWFDQWLKGRDTGILEGPPIRYVLPGAEGWKTADTWPPPKTSHMALALRSDGVLDEREGDVGVRTMMTLGTGLQRVKPSVIDPPSTLTWETSALERDLDVVGELELQLDVTCTAPDAGWIAMIQDVASDGTVTDVTAGYVRASLGTVDETRSRIGAPHLPCRTFRALPPGETVRLRIPLVANARRFKRGHHFRLFLTGNDQDPGTPAIMTFRHAPVGTSCLNVIYSSSRLLVPVTAELE